MRLDPAVHAVRPDLADIRLAGRVLAPHFAAAVAFRATRDCDVTRARDGGAAAVRIVRGERFDVLELADTLAWGTAVASGVVGYVDRDALEPQA